MGVQNIEIKTIKTSNDFDSVISEIVEAHSDKMIVFRGQVTDYPLTASIFRGESSLPAPGCDPFLTASWSNYCRRLLANLSETIIDAPSACLALMQHYGYRSFFVDVTEDPEIALWFALNKFVKKVVPIFVDSLNLRSAKVMWARYELVSNGFIYVLGVTKKLFGERYFSLMKITPTIATRVFRQKAGAISCTGIRRHADDLLLCKIEISDPQKDLINKVRGIKTEFLFPPPYEDRVYKSLCTIPYYVPYNREIGPLNIQLAESILPVPLFANSLRDIVKDYIPLVRILSGERIAFEWNVTQAKTVVDGNQYSGDQAERILVQPLLLEHINEVMPKISDLNLEIWPSNNIIIEFDLDASLVKPSDKPIESLLRGLWMVKSKNELSISRIVDVLDDVLLKGHQIYDISSGSIFLESSKPENHKEDLRTFCLLSKALEVDELKLEKMKVLGYWRLKPKEE